MYDLYLLVCEYVSVYMYWYVCMRRVVKYIGTKYVYSHPLPPSRSSLSLHLVPFPFSASFPLCTMRPMNYALFSLYTLYVLHAICTIQYMHYMLYTLYTTSPVGKGRSSPRATFLLLVFQVQ